MKKLTALIVALSFVGLAAPAFAQAQDEPEREFITMEDMNVDGDVNVPGAKNYDTLQTAKFNPLFDAKRSFMSEVKSSANAGALR